MHDHRDISFPENLSFLLSFLQEFLLNKGIACGHEMSALGTSGVGVLMYIQIPEFAKYSHWLFFPLLKLRGDSDLPFACLHFHSRGTSMYEQVFIVIHPTITI